MNWNDLTDRAKIRDGLWVCDVGGARDICYRRGECHCYNYFFLIKNGVVKKKKKE